MKEEKVFWKSKKWWAAVVAAAIPVLNKVLGLDLNPNELIMVCSPLVGYILGQGIADIGKNSK
tara:strand:+ start:893 stop:1081 length:189 start_codon:yes stop_codon:yes gene_type:complete